MAAPANLVALYLSFSVLSVGIVSELTTSSPETHGAQPGTQVFYGQFVWWFVLHSHQQPARIAFQAVYTELVGLHPARCSVSLTGFGSLFIKGVCVAVEAEAATKS